MLSNVAKLVDQARSKAVEIIWVQHSDEELIIGTEPWEYVPELSREDSEALVHKLYGDSFEATELESILAAAEVGHLIVVGAETDACIRSTIHGAFARGYDVTLVSDAHTASDKTAWGAPPVPAVIEHTNLYWSFQSAPGKIVKVRSTEEVLLELN